MRSGCATAQASPTGPPQSCGTTVASRSSSDSSRASRRSAWLATVHSSRRPGLSERPKPSRSGTMTRYPARLSGPTEGRDVGVEAASVEPAEHLEVLAAEHDPHDRHRQPSIPDPVAEHAGEDLGRVAVGERAAGDLELDAEEVLRPREGGRHELADVVTGDRLVGHVAADRVDQPALEDRLLDERDVVVVHERGRAQDGGGKVERADVLLDPPLGLPVVDARPPFGAAD